MLTSVKERLTAYLDYKGVNKSEFGRRIGVSSAFISSMRKSLQPDKIASIQKEFPDLNTTWLLTGEGEMLQQDLGANATLLGKPTIEIRENLVDVKFYQVTPTATFKDYCQGMQENPDFISILPISGETIDDTSCVFEIHGDSMAPQIQDKAKVLCREIPPTRWHLLSDCVVVIAYAEKFVIKRIAKNRLDSESYLVLESDNPDVPGAESVQLADIRCIFKAERIISQRIN